MTKADVTRFCSALEKFASILKVCSPWVYLTGTIPWKKIGLEDDKWIQAVCDVYTSNPEQARKWQSFTIDGHVMGAIASNAEPTASNNSFVELAFTIKEDRALKSAAKVSGPSCFVNNLPIDSIKFRDVLEDKCFGDDVNSDSFYHSFPIDSIHRS